MSDTPKKRAWLQFHLSTAIVMMFVASGLMWANMHDTSTQQEWLMGDRGRLGWPFVAIEAHPNRSLLPNEPGLFAYIKPLGMAGDSLTALAFVFLAGCICESLIRRRRSTDNGQVTKDQ